MNEGWTARSVAQLVGWGLVILGIVLAFGTCSGEGAGSSHRPGLDSVRTVMEKGAGQAALVVSVAGAIVLLVSLFLRRAGDRS